MSLFKSKKSNKTMLSYSTVTGTVVGPHEISVDGKTYHLFANPMHLADQPHPLDVSAHMGKTVKVSGGVGADTIYEARVVE